MKIPLLIQVLFAVFGGVLLGCWLPVGVVRVFVTLNLLFTQYLGFCIPLIILGLVTAGIAELGTRSGRLLLLTVVLAYASTLFSGFVTYGTCATVFPQLLAETDITTLSVADSALKPYFTIEIPPVAGVLTSLLLAFVLGIGIAAHHAKTLLAATMEFRSLVESLIAKTVVPILPWFIFGLFLQTTAEGNTQKVFTVFAKVIFVVVALHLFLILLQYLVAGIVARKNPLKLLATMLPAYATALGTSSSAATIPVTLAQVYKTGVRREIADFCIPLCATIHLAGSMMKITAFAMAVMFLTNQPIEFATFSGFIALLGVTMVAAPGVPGGAIMAATAVLQSVLGFDANATALMISLYITTDPFGTAGNVVGDGAITNLVDRIAEQ
ncbi:MAG: dicarboxylate/amino acid:cation symporter [Planctomycetia bacterium]|nr:dicarboxylate/amino acid:cation symporter [Planctomycetia bacterium]